MADLQLIGDGAPAAADALDGTEVLHVVQGANSRVTTTQDIADLAGQSGTGYPARGTYTPTLSPNSGTTAVAPVDWVWTRIGNGAGVPAIGDAVTITGKMAASRGVSGQGVVTFDLPFVADVTTSSGTVGAYVLASGAILGALVGLDDANTGSATINALETSALVQFSLTYQTANAVDP